MGNGERGIRKLRAKFRCLAVTEWKGRRGRKHASTGIITTRHDQRIREARDTNMLRLIGFKSVSRLDLSIAWHSQAQHQCDQNIAF